MHLCNKNIHAFIDTQVLHRRSSNKTGQFNRINTFRKTYHIMTPAIVYALLLTFYLTNNTIYCIVIKSICKKLRI